jgi:hypothetical protein
MLDKVKEAHEILKAVQLGLMELVLDESEGAPDVSELLVRVDGINRNLGYLVMRWEARERGE